MRCCVNVNHFGLIRGCSIGCRLWGPKDAKCRVCLESVQYFRYCSIQSIGIAFIVVGNRSNVRRCEEGHNKGRLDGVQQRRSGRHGTRTFMSSGQR